MNIQQSVEIENPKPIDLDLSAIGTPCLVVDAEVIEASYERFVAAMPADMTVRFATKCNPDGLVLRTLFRLGCSFEAASLAEVELLLAMGVEPQEILHSYPHRSHRDIQESADMGVGRWSVDSGSEIEKLAKYVPGARISVRVEVDDVSSRWPLSRKFGVLPEECVELVMAAGDLGLDVDAVSFHVGSQVTDLMAWERAIRLVDGVIQQMPAGTRPSVLNIGGGFPVSYTEPVPEIEAIGASIENALESIQHPMSLEAEPGRYLVAAAGTIVSEVTGVADRRSGRWVFLDVGAFNGLFEASPGGGDLEYPVSAAGHHRDDHDCPSVLGGPSCDGEDTIASGVLLPSNLSSGDRVHIHMAGAYSNAYQRGFCGAPATEVVVVDSRSSGPPVSVGGIDLYRVAWPGSELFSSALELERQWFELSGFVESDGLDGYEQYAAASTFVVVQNPQGDVMSVCRLISASARGFKTTNDFELSPEGRAVFDSVPDQRIMEVGTMATHPAARGLGPTLDVMRGVIDVASRRDVTHLLTSLDAGLFEVFTGDPLYMPCYQIGEPMYYYGSLTVPGFGPLAEHRRVLAAKSPAFHDYLYGSRLARPTV